MLPILIRIAAATQLGAETLRETGLAPNLPLPEHGILIFATLAATCFITDEAFTAARIAVLAIRRWWRRRTGTS